MGAGPPHRARMLAQVHSAALVGCEARLVTVEVHADRGLPHWTLVGLATAAVQESRQRVTAALATAGFDLPARRVTVSLSPESRSLSRRTGPSAA